MQTKHWFSVAYLIAFSLIDLILTVLYCVYATVSFVTWCVRKQKLKLNLNVYRSHPLDGKTCSPSEEYILTLSATEQRSYHWFQPLQLFKLYPNSLPLRHKVQPIRKSFPLAIDNSNPVLAQTCNKVTS